MTEIPAWALLAVELIVVGIVLMLAWFARRDRSHIDERFDRLEKWVASINRRAGTLEVGFSGLRGELRGRGTINGKDKDG